jgi:secreted PhoX family phosphatase
MQHNLVTLDTMNTQQQLRRRFLKMGLAGLGLFAAGGLLRQQQKSAPNTSAAFASLKNIGPLQHPDENGIMLPPGFKSRIIAESGKPPTSNSSYLWHDSPDGGACFATDDGGWIYVSNSELADNAGGAGALRFNKNAEVVDAYSILQNTSFNCAGGATPWGTWLSCEEHPMGLVYECDPFGKKAASVRPALGAFEHEAVAVDSANKTLYLTEDCPDGGFYRFRPGNELSDLSSGTLEIASLQEKEGHTVVGWLTVPDASASETPTRHQAPGYTSFDGGEGIAMHDGIVYFSTKNDNRVWAYDVASQEISILYDAATYSTPELTGVDNIVISPAGDVLVAEDGGNLQIVALISSAIIPVLQLVGHEDSEVTGPAFDPGFQRLYFSSQRGSLGEDSGGITFEISRVA